MLPIAVGADDAAIELKNVLITWLQEKGYNVKDYSDNDENHHDYPDIAYAVASAISNKEHQRGILICGTGIGMNIVVNNG